MWKCPSCGEDVEDEFSACWNCQRGKDGSPAPPAAAAEPGPVGLVETTREDGSIEVAIGDKALTCVVCGNPAFHERNSLLNTRFATFLNLDWTNAQAINYICTRCGYIFWFLAE
jgi:hypothetical protein